MCLIQMFINYNNNQENECSFRGVEMNKYEAEDMLKNYKWKIVSVKLMRKDLETAALDVGR